MTYPDQFTTVPIGYMVLDVVDELYDHSEMTGMFIGLDRAVEVEEIAASEVERVIGGIITK
ncbi:hypothetical protein PP586_gp39 [Pseudoalteromonas phage vB_PspS-H40/1]|uniref:hypothetical protein n=1 Tax=Pseudoalteromonas phage vB_PspS-H40/1 TaxID=1856120 RepID=UPI0007DDF27A|nr:hypothetical protein PP586_gp39 [Pseudoalteromonas phage vB_PspS-H40/1]ANI22056.1 hypothetical protein H401_39 [Pseudoalteromonas phage vB_PspS-H40/1]